MKILAIESSGLVASVAIMTGDVVLAEYTVNYKKTHSQTLLPMLDEIIRMLGFDLEEIEAIAVAEGPGSFTGLRIGAATAKGLGFALDKPLIAIPTVDGLAFNMYATDRLICPLMDARRNQVYTGLYRFEGEKFIIMKEQYATEVDKLVQEINQLGQSVIYLGDGVEAYKELLMEQTKVPFLFAPNHLAKQRAAALGALACKYLTEGKVVTAGEFNPIYLRLSQAEREREEAILAGELS